MDVMHKSKGLPSLISPNKLLTTIMRMLDNTSERSFCMLS